MTTRFHVLKLPSDSLVCLFDHLVPAKQIELYKTSLESCLLSNKISFPRSKNKSLNTTNTTTASSSFSLPSNMVQKNGPDILKPNTKLKTIHGKTENMSSNQNQDIKSNEVANLRKKLKKKRSIKRISELENLEAHVSQPYIHRNKTGKRKKAGASGSSTPNYMKPTTSSDARNKQPMVSLQIPIIHKKQVPISSKKLGSSSCKSKPAKLLARILTWKSSLRVASNTSKKCSGINLHPEINASKATCSSTLKDSKFPEELELSPGATEAEGTSIMKVCPYTYCSLNGHKHKTLPSLRSFKVARRRLLKSQKSLKLKGISSFRKRGLRKTKKDTCTWQDEIFPCTLQVPSFGQEMNDDYVAKISNRTCVELEKLIFPENKTEAACDNASVLSETLSVSKSKKERGTTIANRPTYGYSSNVGFEGNIVRVSDLSVSVVELSTVSAEYGVCDEQEESQEPNLLQVLIINYSEKSNLLHDDVDIEKLCKSEANEIFPGASDMDAYNEDIHKDFSGDICASEHAKLDETEGHEQVREVVKDNIDRDEYLNSDISSDEETHEDDICNVSTEDSTNAASSEICDDVSGKIPESPLLESLDVQEECSCTRRNANFVSITFTNQEEDTLQEAEYDTDISSEYTQEVDNKASEGEHPKEAESESTWLEALQDLKAVQTGILCPIYDDFERRGEDDVVSDTKNTFKIQVPEDDFVEPDQENSKEDCVKAKPDSEVGDDIKKDSSLDTAYWNNAEKDAIVGQGTDGVEKDSCNTHDSADYQSDIGSFKGNEEKSEKVMFQDYRTETVGMSRSCNVLDDGMNHETRIKNYQEPHGKEERLLVDFYTEQENVVVTEITTIPDQFLSEIDNVMKARYNITRARINEDQEKHKAFNPREPNFLPTEPDPEAEIVDLRHQMLDDRKNTEEWMVDYRLRRVVSSLRPARKSKVELLVEAFEAVTPLSLNEVSPGDGSPFNQVQAMQACN